MTIIREAFTDEVEQVLIDSPEKFKTLRRYVHSFAPHLTKRMTLWKDRISLLERYGIEEQIAKLILNKVKLSSGGWIMIEQSEALTAIDVNSGGFTAQGGPEETAFQLNCEAAKEVMHQLRLRNIGGIIIVDFVDMARREHREKLVQLLTHETSKDKAKIDILPVTRLGLVQITRQRKTPSLAHVLCRECPWCQGSGLLLSPQTVYIQVKKKILRSAPGIPGRRLDVSVHPDVGRLFDKKTISELSRRLKKEIHIRLDYTLHPNDCKLS
jgi:ribonuclease G